MLRTEDLPQLVAHDPSRRTAVLYCRAATVIKARRIIDEWDTGVKWKISLSFNGIINIAIAAEDAGSEL